MSESTPGRLAGAQSLYVEFLLDGKDPRGDAFDALCAAHPEHAELLLELRSSWLRVTGVLDELKSSSGHGTTSIELIREKYGAGVDPSLAIQVEESDDPSSEVLKRLSTRGTTMGRYRLKGEIGRGGMGAILRVWDEDLRRNLAMKVVLGKQTSDVKSDTPPVDSRTLGRFLEEAQVTGQLDHPGVVPVHELGVDEGGHVYFTMKLVKGVTLKEVFARVHAGDAEWNLTRTIGILLKVCETMAYAHDKRVIHRDLKPANIMVGRFGEVHVMDWGLAHVLGHEDGKDIRIVPEPVPLTSEVRTERRDLADRAPDSPLVTMDGDIVGTPAYMSPEQALGHVEAVDERSDVYCVGAMLYHLLAARMPYVQPGAKIDNYALLMWVREQAPISVGSLAPEASPELVAICEKAMARDKSERYATMLAFAEDLRAYLEGRVVRAFERGAVAELRKWVGRNKGVAASLVAFILAVAGGGFVVAWQSERARHEVEGLLDGRTATVLHAQAEESWAIHPDSVDGMTEWLGTARELVGSLPEYGHELERLRALAMAVSEPRPIDDPTLRHLLDDYQWMWSKCTVHLADARAALLDPEASEEDVAEAPHEIAVLSVEVPFWKERIEELEASLAPKPAWSFADEAVQQEHDRLATAVDEIHRIEREVIPRVEARILQASELEQTIRGPAAEPAWDRVRASMADMEVYGRRAIEPQLGLEPLDVNEQGLWEFHHVLSGTRPELVDGRYEVTGETGIVFVLIPSLPGCRDPATHDRHASEPNESECPKEKEHASHRDEVRLDPFFISKYELTQGQWLRLARTKPSRFYSGKDIKGEKKRYSRSHPVDNVNWLEGERFLPMWGLDFPTEVQWTVASRGGSDAGYWWGDDFDSHPGVNYSSPVIDDPEDEDHGHQEDGWLTHAPVDSYVPNGYGLYCILGNVSELCMDWKRARETDRAVTLPGTGEIVPPHGRVKARKGGSWRNSAKELRFGHPSVVWPSWRIDDLGVRPIRILTH